jgi:hypothetical protein
VAVKHETRKVARLGALARHRRHCHPACFPIGRSRSSACDAPASGEAAVT